MHIVGFLAEDFKKLRVVEITPKGKLVQITGKNGQGKTSVLDAVWAGLLGAKATPEMPVRKGAVTAKIKLDLGELILTRHIGKDGMQNLTVETADGVRKTSPQAVLDKLMGHIAFDPLEFATLKPKVQAEMLRHAAKIDYDADAANTANKLDYDDRTAVNHDISALESQLGMITVQPNLPKAKLDEAAIVTKIAEVDAINEAARKQDDAKRLVVDAAARVEKQLTGLHEELEKAKARVKEIEVSIKEVKGTLIDLNKELKVMPDAVYAQTAELAKELQDAQITNREIEKRVRHDLLTGQLNNKKRERDELTRRMKNREEEKRNALAKAKLPVEGLSFDEEGVTLNGIPMEQLGEAEKIRVSTLIAMAANPTLRVIRILHGEALDEDSLALLAQIAEEHDYQIWMARVDSSGKVGIVMEDGSIKANAE